MLDAPIIQVILGLIFIFSLFSVIVTQINATIAALLHMRADLLKKGIHDLLTDPITRAKFMAHPLIQLVPKQVQPTDKLTAQAASEIVDQKPTDTLWIDADLFSDALIDILNASSRDRLFRGLYMTADAQLTGAEEIRVLETIRRFENGGAGLSELQTALASVENGVVRQALQSELDKVLAMQTELLLVNPNIKLIPLLAGVQEVHDAGMRTVLETLLASASTIDEARLKLENWYNSCMRHLTEVYKRNMTRISFIVGIIVVLVLNVDTLHIARTLWNDPAIRSTVATAADVALSTGMLGRQVESAQAAQSVPATPDSDSSSGESAASPDLQSLDSALSELLALRIPIGWVVAPIEGGCPGEAGLGIACSDGRNLWLASPSNNGGWLGWLVSKLIGLAITVVAIGQGAPFWFDLLNRIARGPESRRSF